jgi:hypothetical protein
MIMALSQHQKDGNLMMEKNIIFQVRVAHGLLLHMIVKMLFIIVLLGIIAFLKQRKNVNCIVEYKKHLWMLLESLNIIAIIIIFGMTT